jgi:hypothetical protein
MRSTPVPALCAWRPGGETATSPAEATLHLRNCPHTAPLRCLNWKLAGRDGESKRCGVMPCCRPSRKSREATAPGTSRQRAVPGACMFSRFTNVAAASAGSRAASSASEPRATQPNRRTVATSTSCCPTTPTTRRRATTKSTPALRPHRRLASAMRPSVPGWRRRQGPSADRWVGRREGGLSSDFLRGRAAGVPWKVRTTMAGEVRGMEKGGGLVVLGRQEAQGRH